MVYSRSQSSGELAEHRANVRFREFGWRYTEQGDASEGHDGTVDIYQDGLLTEDSFRVEVKHQEKITFSPEKKAIRYENAKLDKWYEEIWSIHKDAFLLVIFCKLPLI